MDGCYHCTETSQDSASEYHEASSLCSWTDSTITVYITVYVLELLFGTVNSNLKQLDWQMLTL